ncbi:MAG: hypothetical protein PWQ91_1123 [Eubacteriales bacterium]|nr:hypothetical protein [Eubacteriales bacterium]MDN5364062.1 hypothetical protein [Eubacteriales bacterium]
MYKILRKKVLCPTLKLFEVEALHVARNCKPGQLLFSAFTRRVNGSR